VEPLFPLGHLCVVLAQSGVGKSFATEYLAGCVAFGKDYLGMKTTYGNILIVDQDTPTDVLEERLGRIAAGMGGPPRYTLAYESMQDHAFNWRLYQMINEANPTLVVIDSLHSLCGKSNSNSTLDMSKLAELKARCLTPDRTIIINHHLTEKTEHKVETLMDYNTHLSGMGSSVIKQQCDTEYILAATVSDNLIDRMYLRPIAKRQAIPQKVITMCMVESSTHLTMEFGGYYHVNLTEIESDMLLLMELQPKDWTIKKMKEECGDKWTAKEIRKALTSLGKKGHCRMSTQAHNTFTYRLIRPDASLPPSSIIDTTPLQPDPPGGNGNDGHPQPQLTGQPEEEPEVEEVETEEAEIS